MMTITQPRFGSIIIKRATLDKEKAREPIATLEVELTDRERFYTPHVAPPTCAYANKPQDSMHQHEIFGMDYLSTFTIQTQKAHQPPVLYPSGPDAHLLSLESMPFRDKDYLLDNDYLLKESHTRRLLSAIMKEEAPLRRLFKTILSKPKKLELGPGVSLKDVRATTSRMLETMNEDPRILKQTTRHILGR